MGLEMNRLAFKAALSLAIAGLILGPKKNAEASTVAEATVRVDILNFSTNSLLLSNNTTAFTEAIALGDAVANVNNAASLFQADPVRVQNLTEGISEGWGSYFLGRTNGTASATGLFWVEDEFSFDFTTQLAVRTAVEQLTQEASAFAELSFSIFTSETLDGPVTLADSFTLAGFVSSRSTEDQLLLESGANTTLAPLGCPPEGDSTCITQSFGGLSEVAAASVQGRFHQTFEQPTFVALVENQWSATQVRVPEPTSSWLLMGMGMMAIASRRLKQESGML